MSQSANSLYQRAQELQPWELINQLEQEKLDVRGNETQLRARLLSRQLERAYPTIPMPSCEVGKEEEWLELVRQFEGSIEKQSSLTKTRAWWMNDFKRERELKLSEIPKCRMILDELFTEKHSSYAWPFYKPFDTEFLQLRDYNDVIKNHMDLSIVKQKMDKGMYNWSLEFAVDIRRIFSNCHEYFNSGHQFRWMASQLEKVFETRFFAEIYGTSIMDEMPEFKVVPINGKKSSTDNNSIRTEDDGMPSSMSTQRELEAELKSTRQTMVEMMTEIKTLREELAENRKRMESLEAAVVIQKENTKPNETENQELEEDGITYRAKCSQLMQIWKNSSEARQTPKGFLQNLNDFRKFARISDHVLFELLPCVSPWWVKDFFRSKTFDSWESFEEKFHQNFRENFTYVIG